MSPYASGGGTVLEHLYGAILLSSLLVGHPVAELGDDATAASVRFQGRSLSPVDDLIVSGSARDGRERRAAIGVRRAPDLTSSDTKRARPLAGYVQMVAEWWDDATAGRWRLYLAVAVPSPAVNQLRELTDGYREHGHMRRTPRGSAPGRRTPSAPPATTPRQ